MSFIVSVCILNRLLVVGFNFFFWRYYVRWHLCPNCLNGQRRADNLTFPLVNNAYILTCLCNNTSYLLYLLGSRGSPFFDYRGRFCGKSRWLHQEKERVQIQVPFSASSISRTQRKKVKRFFLFSTAVPLKGSTRCFIRKCVAILDVDCYPMFDSLLPFISQIQCWSRIPFPS